MICAFIAGCAAQAPYLRLDTSLEKDIKVFDGARYIPLIRLCDVYNVNCKWDSFTKTATLERKGKRITLRTGSERILVNDNAVTLDKPVLLSGGTVFVPVLFVRNNLGAIVEMPSLERAREEGIPKKFTIKTIVIDPGHGGKDAGAIGRRMRLREKQLTLAISKRLKEVLERDGLKIIMTRDRDVFIPLSQRVEIANRNNADLFVSIHVNASRSKALKGFECYYLSDATDDNARALEALENASLGVERNSILEHSKSLDKTLWDMKLTENRLESVELAGNICDAVENSLAIRNRGIRSARFYVLKGTRMPAVLVEMGYISNRYEEIKMKDQSFLDRVTEAVAKGILAYKDEYERTQGFTKI